MEHRVSTCAHRETTYILDASWSLVFASLCFVATRFSQNLLGGFLIASVGFCSLFPGGYTPEPFFLFCPQFSFIRATVTDPPPHHHHRHNHHQIHFIVILTSSWSVISFMISSIGQSSLFIRVWAFHGRAFASRQISDP